MIVIHTKTDSFELEELPLENGFIELLDFLSTQDVLLSDQHRLAVLYHQQQYHDNAIKILNLAIENNILLTEEVEKLNIILLSLYIELYFKDPLYYSHCNKLFQKLENPSKNHQPLLNICKGYFFLRTEKYDIGQFLFSGQSYPLAILGLSFINLLQNNSYTGDNKLFNGINKYKQGFIMEAVKHLEEEYENNKNVIFYLIRLSDKYKISIIKYFLEHEKNMKEGEAMKLIFSSKECGVGKSDIFIDLEDLPQNYKENNDFKVTMINFYIDLENYDEARKFIEGLRDEDDREYFLGKIMHINNKIEEAKAHYKKSDNIYANYSLSRINLEDNEILKDIKELHEFYAYLQIRNNNTTDIDINKLSGHFKDVVDVIKNENTNIVETYKKYKKIENSKIISAYAVQNNKAYFLHRIKKILSPFEQERILEENKNIDEEIIKHINTAIDLYSKSIKELDIEDNSINVALKYNKARIENDLKTLKELSEEDDFYLLNYTLVKNDIKNIKDRNIRGYILYKNKKYEEALKEVKKENNLFSLLLKGTIYFEQKCLNKAFSIFMNVLKKESYCFYAANMLGILLSESNIENSKIIFKRLATIDKNIRKNLAIAYYKLSDYEKSYYYFKRSLPLNNKVFSLLVAKLKEKDEGREIIEEIENNYKNVH